MAILLILVLFAIGIVCLYWHRSKYWEKRGISGPQSQLFFGNLRHLGKSNKKSWAYTFLEWTQKYGKVYGIQRGWRNTLVISDHAMAREIMVDKFEYFHERDLAPIAGNVDKDPLQHVFTSRGKRWKRLRALTSPAFSVKNLKTILPTIEYCAGETTRLLDKHANDGKTFNIREYFAEFTMDAICRVGLGITDCQQFGNKYTRLVTRILDDFDNNFVLITWITPFLGSYLRLLQLGGAILGQLDFVNMIKMLRKNISDRKTSREAESASGEKSTDFIDLFLDAEIEETDKLTTETSGVYNKANGVQIVKKLSTDELLAQCFLFLFAGFDTTANTLSFTSYYLAIHPEIQEKMRQEIEDICVSPNPTYEELKKLKYSEAVMMETLRFNPIGASIASRKCAGNTTIGNIEIEKGTDVILDVLSLHFDEEVWGKDAKEFKPERWFDSNVPHSSFYSFGAGPRVCAGLRLAIIEQKMLLTHLLRKYRILKTPQLKLKISGFIMHPEKIEVRLEHLK